MSADDSTLIISIRINKKKAYFVFRTQAAENFQDVRWFIQHLKMLAMKWTYSLHKAIQIAKRIEKKKSTEYGIVFENYNVDILYNSCMFYIPICMK